MKFILFIVFFLLTVQASFSQEVKTLADTPIGLGDGMTVSDEGDVYVGVGTENGKIIKITTDGEVSDFATGFNTPVGLDFDSNGSLFIANYSIGIISKVDSEGQITDFASGLNGPAGLYINDSDEIFVSLYGIGSSAGNGRTILKFNSDGSSETLIVGSGIKDGIGIYGDENNNIYATNWRGGKIFKIEPAANINEIGTISGARINHIAYSKGFIYVPAPNLHKIFKVDASTGIVENFAGTGSEGDVDGSLSTAQFRNPNSAAISNSGDTLYILDPNAGKVKMIDLNQVTDVKDITPLPKEIRLNQNYPNPFNPSTVIGYSIPIGGFVTLKIYDLLGNEIETLVNEFQSEGPYSVSFNSLNLSTGGQALSSGVYFYTLRIGRNFFETKKMLLIR